MCDREFLYTSETNQVSRDAKRRANWEESSLQRKAAGRKPSGFFVSILSGWFPNAIQVLQSGVFVAPAKLQPIYNPGCRYKKASPTPNITFNSMHQSREACSVCVASSLFSLVCTFGDERRYLFIQNSDDSALFILSYLALGSQISTACIFVSEGISAKWFRDPYSSCFFASTLWDIFKIGQGQERSSQQVLSV
jgi:hypothetical protein